eukprot:scaffold8767_cov121-Isochrysis_galbana.AAC.10
MCTASTRAPPRHCSSTSSEPAVERGRRGDGGLRAPCCHASCPVILGGLQGEGPLPAVLPSFHRRGCTLSCRG